MTEPTLSQHLDSARQTDADRRRYAQNSLILDTAIALNKAIEQLGISQKELAEKLSKTEGYVSQVLSGGGNLTLRTLADFAYGLGFVVDVVLKRNDRIVSVGRTQATERRPSWVPVDVSVPAKEPADSQCALAA